jgi:teichoic acid transport system ATP-binding protein
MTEIYSKPGASVSADLDAAAVSIRGLRVRFKVYEDKSRDSARRIRSRRSTEVIALHDLNLDIKVGEGVGLIGSNGSGKSTLVRSIAGLQAKVAGSVKVRGEARMLGVNAALKPTLSGYRNIYLGGLAMGLGRDELDDKIDTVIDFAGLQEAIHRPISTYSSGMRSRLAFAIATLRIPDVLLVDEALAVGDRSFRAKSLTRIREIRDQAGTIIMVSHNLNEIRTTCKRAIWLDRGAIKQDGLVSDVCDAYESQFE